MPDPILFGATYSVYVRIARLALAEKGVAYHLEEVDIFAKGGPPLAHMARHPFGRIPAFEHDGFRLYETGAITRYIDEAFPGTALQPTTPKARARVNQVVSLLDNYAYRTLVWDIYVERMLAAENGRVTDEAKIADALPRAETCLRALEAQMAEGPWLTGPALTLADLHAAPMFAYAEMAPEGAALIARHDGIRRWWEKMALQPSMTATRFPVERSTQGGTAHRVATVAPRMPQ